MVNEIITNIKGLALPELEKLQQSIVKERGLREKRKSIYTHDCYRSSNYHFGKYKHYSKRITAIDSNKINGYAFRYYGRMMKYESLNFMG
ncbi:MAG TPA: hypothetical protein GX707_15010 [Epulopiscium sp.]|nr:hypothetical protein [Candidatus Epulonipiscium sp.]